MGVHRKIKKIIRKSNSTEKCVCLEKVFRFQTVQGTNLDGYRYSVDRIGNSDMSIHHLFSFFLTMFIVRR